MDKHKRYTLDYILIALLAVVIVVLLAYMLNRYHLNDEVGFTPEINMVDNPLMGYAPSAEDTEACADTNLVFIKLRWADWEPEQGQYDTAFLEEAFHISRWKAEGKHAVLRFLCDEPGEAGHADIPDWLLEETGDGTFYTGSSGEGYSPNYENEYLRSRHELAVAALAEYFNQDSFLAYVEFGSLGHWGEWHARDGDGSSLMPSAETCWDYILDYTVKFQNVRFLMRRSYSYAVEAQLGLYNDMLGSQEETERWLQWIAEGGTQETLSDEIEILPYGDFWEAAPAGGEITSSVAPETLYDAELSSLLSQAEDCHLTFLGPNIPDRERYPSAYDAVLRRLGYRYYVSRLSTTVSFADDTLDVQMDWENAGSAPLYWDWPVMLQVFDTQGTLVYWETLDLQLSRLAPGETITTDTKVPLTDDILSGLSIGITVKSYDGKEGIRLAMDTGLGTIEGSQIIYSTQQNTDQ